MHLSPRSTITDNARMDFISGAVAVAVEGALAGAAGILGALVETRGLPAPEPGDAAPPWRSRWPNLPYRMHPRKHSGVPCAPWTSPSTDGFPHLWPSSCRHRRRAPLEDFTDTLAVRSAPDEHRAQRKPGRNCARHNSESCTHTRHGRRRVHLSRRSPRVPATARRAASDRRWLIAQVAMRASRPPGTRRRNGISTKKLH